ncbi:hypothetical protein DRQ36_02850 [bacterium]|nr:MAG: hypothetical protein DRQ36_02850 [bacterium]
MSEALKIYFWYSTAGALVFFGWLIFVSPRVRGEGPTRNRAVIIGVVFLIFLLLPDIWALTRLSGISWYVAWAIGLLFFHIIEGGIWHRICWGDKCPECGAWLKVTDEPVPDNPNVARRTGTCPKCGWTDSWAITVRKNR